MRSMRSGVGNDARLVLDEARDRARGDGYCTISLPFMIAQCPGNEQKKA
jgi:hypothetical protein